MDSSDRSDNAKGTATAELPVLQPEFAAPLKLGRCPIDPKTLEPMLCSNPKLDSVDLSKFDDQFRDKAIFPLIKDDPALLRTQTNSFKLDLPAAPPHLDLRFKIDKITSFDLNFNGRPAEMSLNPRKCGTKARAGFCLKMGF